MRICFVVRSQIEEEIIKVLNLILFILRSFGFNEYKVYLSTRPDKFVGSEESWEKATNALKVMLWKNHNWHMKLDPWRRCVLRAKDRYKNKGQP